MKANLKAGLWIGATILIVGLFVLLPIGQRALKAAQTLPGIDLTNIAKITWDSGVVSKTNDVSNLTIIVGTNYGMTWIGTTNMTMGSGVWITNDTYITNDGNATADIILTFTSNKLVNTSSKVWSNYFTNDSVASPATNILRLQISQAGGMHVWFYVFAPADETNGSYETFQCLASNSNATAEFPAPAFISNYTGFNGTLYGGNIGRDAAGSGNTWLSNTEPSYTNWKVTVLVADIVVTKTAAFTNPQPYANPAVFLTPVPGAQITYRLTFTNQGGLTGQNVKLVDTMPTNYVVYSNGSMRRGAINNVFSDYATLPGIPTDLIGDDDGSTNPAAADQLVFSPTNGSGAAHWAPANGGFVGPGDSGTYFYQVILK